MSSEEEKYKKLLDRLLEDIDELEKAKKNKAYKFLSLNKYLNEFEDYADQHKEVLLFFISKSFADDAVLNYIRSGRTPPRELIQLVIDYIKSVIITLKKGKLEELARVFIDNTVELLAYGSEEESKS